jgi:hypothetical protein
MSCLIEGQAVYGEGSLSFGQVCEYAVRTPISVRTTLEIAHGLIRRQTDMVKRPRSADTSE